MNSLKVLMAALMFGAFSLTITGCPGKQDSEVENTVEDASDSMGDAVDDAADEIDDAADDATEEM